MKSQRQQLILKIISERNIDTQENLQQALKEHGCAVTQATVSRDIKELALIKTITGCQEIINTVFRRLRRIRLIITEVCFILFFRMQ